MRPPYTSLHTSVSYGSSVFEGIRCYATTGGPAVFRLNEHIRRLMDSAKIYRMEMSATSLATCGSDAGTGARQPNGFVLSQTNRDARVWRSRCECHEEPRRCLIACWKWGKYLGEEAIAEGVDVCVSSWTRMAPNTLPALAKAGANYMNSQLIKMEAITNGYVEGIALDATGYVSEGSGENFRGARRKDFDAAAGRLRAARYHARCCSHPGARYGYSGFRSKLIPRELLYIADEVFFSVRRRRSRPSVPSTAYSIGKGTKPRTIAEQLQHEFFRNHRRFAPGQIQLAFAGTCGAASGRKMSLGGADKQIPPPPGTVPSQMPAA